MHVRRDDDRDVECDGHRLQREHRGGEVLVLRPRAGGERLERIHERHLHLGRAPQLDLERGGAAEGERQDDRCAIAQPHGGRADRRARQLVERPLADLVDARAPLDRERAFHHALGGHFQW